jgi:cysteinyl-tRNA synthetase
MQAISATPKLTTATETTGIDIANWQQRCYDAMNDDFNTPILIATLFEGVKFVQAVAEGTHSITAKDRERLHTVFTHFVFDVLGLCEETQTLDDQHLSGAMKLLIQLREEARKRKDFSTSDQIRDQLKEAGIELKDGKDGTTYNLS